MESSFILVAVIGFTQMVKSLFDRDYRSVVIIIGAAAIGAFAGFLHVQGVDIATGIVLGLGAAGVVTTAQAIRSQV